MTRLNQLFGLFVDDRQARRARFEREIRADDADVVGHDGLHLALGLDDHQHLFGVLGTFEIPVGNAFLDFDRSELRGGVFGGLVGIDDRFDQGVRSQPVGAVQSRAGGFAQRIEPPDRRFRR